MCLIALVPSIYISLKNPVIDKYTGRNSSYQGVLELWNIDTFESGTVGKHNYLTGRALDYESYHKGLYIMVKNMTETECKLALENGQRPAMFSFGVGMGESILSYLQTLDGVNTNNVLSNFLQSGKVEEQLMAIPWCTGIYSIITSDSHLKLANTSLNGSLGAMLTNCGFQTTLKNQKIKTTYSVSFGGGSYTNPQKAYAITYGNIAKTETSIEDNYSTKTAYNAYCDFVENKSTMLLGTQRDVARIENRLSVGKIQDVYYEHLTAYTDLVQYISIAKTDNLDILNACLNFVEYLTTESVQLKLKNIGMFSVSALAQVMYTDGQQASMQHAITEYMQVTNVFTTTAQLQANKQNYIS